MGVDEDVLQRPDVPAEERVAHNRVLQILKLRWMGLAKEDGQALRARRTAKSPRSLLRSPYNTD